MSDIIDDANEVADIFLRSALYEHQRREKLTPTPGIGQCLYCRVDVEGERRWCGPVCRDAWEMTHRETAT